MTQSAARYPFYIQTKHIARYLQRKSFSSTTLNCKGVSFSSYEHYVVAFLPGTIGKASGRRSPLSFHVFSLSPRLQRGSLGAGVPGGGDWVTGSGCVALGSRGPAD